MTADKETRRTREGVKRISARKHGARSGVAKPKSYHHGDLRAALLAAAEDELAENGVQGFTLRGCARRAGVSHAAPAHHFKDVEDLLAELAAIGFERLSETMAAFARKAEIGTVDYLVETGRGYVTFAADNPHLFRLTFGIDAVDCTNPRYQAAGAVAFSFPVDGVGALIGSSDPMSEPVPARVVIGCWSIVHGLSELMLSGQFNNRPGVTRQTMIDTTLPAIVRRFLSDHALPTQTKTPPE